MSREMLIENVGPIRKLEFAVPEEGGVVVLQGRNGAGKSHALSAVQSLVSGDGTVPVRDGEPKATVEGLGATIRVGKRTTRSGELEVESLVGDVDPATLVDPGIQDPERADAARIKALLTLAGVQAEPADFMWNGTTISLPEDETDPVKLAGMAAREYQRLAREQESAVTNLEGRIAKLGVVAVEYDGETDADMLEDRLVSARANLETLKKLRSDHERQQQTVTSAKAKLAEVAGDIEERLAKARKEYAEASQKQDAAYKLVEEVKARLAEVTRDLHNAGQAVLAAGKMCDQLGAEAERHAELRAAVNPESWVPEVTDEALQQAEQAIADARDAMQKATLVRQNAETAKEREFLENEKIRTAATAETLRGYAGRCENALSLMVGKTGTGLFVEGGRLRMQTDRGEGELFADLSHGERWKAAIDVCVNATGENSVLVIPQEAWEGIDPANRRALNEHARNRRVVVLTAECADCDIKAEVME
jgi:energy-coupling factor transporter ATP-binding protein EcfA2